MDYFVYKYRCEKTGKTHEVDKVINSKGKSPDASTLKLEATCQDCGQKQSLFVEEKKTN